ncbi:MAG: substrate-binding domain-containing protein [Cyclobacteriaceae bacterium]|nr:substrate-binding domain-containing protein [Cyclobacteriaceae bacterium]
MVPRLFKLIFLLLIISILFQNCQDKKVKIGFLLDDFSSERWYKDRDLFIRTAEEMGGIVMVDSALRDIKKQYDQAKIMLDNGADVLVVVPVNSEHASTIVKLAHSYDVPVISYDRLIQNCDLDYYISFENVEVGELMADYLSKRNPVGNYVIISGPPSDNNSKFIKLGQMGVLQPLIEKGDIKVVYDSFVNEWDTEEGYNHMKSALKNSNSINAVLCANDALAQGAIRALEESSLAGSVLVSGQDAELEAIRNIMAGYQTMTVYKPIEAIAYTAANTAIKLAKHEPVTHENETIWNGQKMVPAILLPSMVVNRDNIDMTVISDGYLKEHNLVQ